MILQKLEVVSALFFFGSIDKSLEVLAFVDSPFDIELGKDEWSG